MNSTLASPMYCTQRPFSSTWTAAILTLARCHAANPRPCIVGVQLPCSISVNLRSSIASSLGGCEEPLLFPVDEALHCDVVRSQHHSESIDTDHSATELRVVLPPQVITSYLSGFQMTPRSFRLRNTCTCSVVATVRNRPGPNFRSAEDGVIV